jgi:GT2 family glycosyltransferase
MSKSQTILLPSALVVCTRNRSESVRELLASISAMTMAPKAIVIVDSSEDGKTRSVVDASARALRSGLVYVRSLPGAAHQKNQGIEYLKVIFPGEQIDIVHFLDDDIAPSANYFEKAVQAFRDTPDAAAVGGFDNSLEKQEPSWLRDILFLGQGSEDGIILKSGICLVPFPSTHMKKVDWVPGGMVNVRWDAAKVTMFDGRIRIYGDEVEMQLRLAPFGEIFISPSLGVLHKSERKGKDSRRIEESYMDGFRWTLSKKVPERVKPIAVIYTTLALIAAELFRALISFDFQAFTRAQGHVDFLVRLLTRREVQQFVSHKGSGPYVA